MSDARILEVDEAAYRADPCDVPSLSASTAWTLLEKSPAHAYQHHPRLGGVPREPSAATDHGTLIHALLLGGGPELEVLDVDDWRTKAARLARDEARLTGRIPIKRAEMDAASSAARALEEKLRERGIDFSEHDTETAIAWVECSSQGPMQCRGRLDAVKGAVIRDLKTTRSAHPRDCAKHIVNYGGELQHAAYRRALSKLVGIDPAQVRFEFVFVETAPPFGVTVGRLNPVFQELGEMRWDRAVELWGSCVASGRWPSYGDRAAILEPPGWALRDELEEAS